MLNRTKGSQLKIAIIGECMIELSQSAENQYSMSYGGDTLNTAVYLSRCGGQSDYFTVLGNDSFSQKMLSQWHKEGVGIEQVKINKNKMPGLYMIENDENGERYFHYWRDTSPARTLFSDFPDVLEALSQYQLIFLSGITLSLYSTEDLDVLFSFLDKFRQAGGQVTFDNNYRPRNWPSVEYAQKVYNQMVQLTDTALLSFDDEVELYGEHTPEQCIARWESSGVAEIVVKNGHKGCYLTSAGKTELIALDHVCQPVDTTAAGDSFNGAYLAEKMRNQSSYACIKAGQVCASIVIMHKGAIIDPSINLTEIAS